MLKPIAYKIIDCRNRVSSFGFVCNENYFKEISEENKDKNLTVKRITARELQQITAQYYKEKDRKERKVK